MQINHILIMDTYLCSKINGAMHAYITCRKACRGKIKAFSIIVVMSCAEAERRIQL